MAKHGLEPEMATTHLPHFRFYRAFYAADSAVSLNFSGGVMSHPPGPPPTPRCSECNRVIGYDGHDPKCSLGLLHARRWQRVHIIEQTLTEALRERKDDDEFMARLAARVQSDKAILDKLAEA